MEAHNSSEYFMVENIFKDISFHHLEIFHMDENLSKKYIFKYKKHKKYAQHSKTPLKFHENDLQYNYVYSFLRFLFPSYYLFTKVTNIELSLFNVLLFSIFTSLKESY